MITMLRSIRSPFTRRGAMVQYMMSFNHTTTPKSEEAQEISKEKKESERMAEFRKKLRETTPIDDLGEQPFMHQSQKNDPLPPFPDNTNPITGEIGGPRGPEPTRYGDWERKGRVSDF